LDDLRNGRGMRFAIGPTLHLSHYDSTRAA
jgi:hypothetical protein